MAYVGSVVGFTRDVDKSTLNRSNFVRIKLATRDVTKMSGVAEGVRIPFLYDFFYEREVVDELRPMQVHVDKDEKELPHSTKKKNVMDPSSSAQAQQMEAIPLTEGDTSKIKGSAQQVDQCTMVAFPDESKSQVDITSSVGKDDKLKTIMEIIEVDTEDSYENRVQGLSGNNMLESDDDLLSGEVQVGSVG
jgi:hypothetical protein